MLKAAKRLQGIEPFHVMNMLARVKQLEAAGEDIVHMEVGEPDFQTAPSIMQAAVTALQKGESHYTAPLGLEVLRQKLAAYYQQELACTVDWQNIALTSGASGAIHLVLAAVIDPGDEVLLTDPGYPCNRHVVRLLSGVDVNVPLAQGDGFVLTAEQLKAHITPRSKAVMIASPSNPTGTVYTREQIRALAEVCRQHNLHLIVDEIYQGLNYGQAPFSAAEIADNIWIINSFSKYFGMTGLRLGWLLAPPGMMRHIEKLIQNLFLAPVTIAQFAALAALSEPALSEHKKRAQIFRQRRDFLLPALESIGFKIEQMPQGAFYLYANCQKWGMPASQLAQLMLDQAKVAVTPGKDFALQQAEHFIRFAYTTDQHALQQGVERLQKLLAHV